MFLNLINEQSNIITGKLSFSSNVERNSKDIFTFNKKKNLLIVLLEGEVIPKIF